MAVGNRATLAAMPKNRKPPKRRKPTRKPIRVNLPNGRHYLADARYPTYGDYERAGEQAFWEVMNEGAATEVAGAMLKVAKARNLRAKRLA
jgi:hypothetical protein